MANGKRVFSTPSGASRIPLGGGGPGAANPQPLGSLSLGDLTQSRRAGIQSGSQLETAQNQRLTNLLSGPGAGVQSGMQALVNQFNQSFGSAKSQNEARFQRMLGLEGSTRQQMQDVSSGSTQEMLDLISGTTDQRAADIRTGAEGERGDIRQRLARSGLGGSSVGTVQEGGSRKRENESLNRLADAFQGTQLNVMDRSRADQLGILGQSQDTRLGILNQMQPAFPDLASLQSTLGGVASQFEGGSGLEALLQSLSRIRS